MKWSTEVNGITLLGNQHENGIRYGGNVIKGLSAFLKESVSFKAIQKKYSDYCFLAYYFDYYKTLSCSQKIEGFEISSMAFKCS